MTIAEFFTFGQHGYPYPTAPVLWLVAVLWCVPWWPRFKR